MYFLTGVDQLYCIFLKGGRYVDTENLTIYCILKIHLSSRKLATHLEYVLKTLQASRYLSKLFFYLPKSRCRLVWPLDKVGLNFDGCVLVIFSELVY